MSDAIFAGMGEVALDVESWESERCVTWRLRGLSVVLKGVAVLDKAPQHRRAPAGPSCMRRSAKRSVKPGRSTMRRAPMDKTPLDRRVTAEGLRIAFDSALAP